MSKYQWYFGDGTFLEGEEAYEHVRKLNQNVIETKKLINQQLNHFMDYLNEYDENDSDDFEALFDNVMEIGERCSEVEVMMEVLIERIKERIG